MGTRTRKRLFSGWLARGFMSLVGGATLLTGLDTGCGTQEQLANSELDDGAPFVVVKRTVSAETKALRQRSLRTAGVVDQAGYGDDFYLAINKKELGKDKKWFLSAYMKQFFPGNVGYGAARSMGTKVVSFKQQNGKVFVFNTDDTKKASDVFDPEVLVEAFPIVAYPPFDRLPGSSAFVLIDPSNGLNDFGLIGDAFAGGSAPDRFKVEVSYLQNYRETTNKDGITFEQVFTGYGQIADPNAGGLGEPNAFRASGTLGMSIRRYSETMGFKPAPRTTSGGQDLYFLGQPKQVPNEGVFVQNAIKWGVSATKPVEFVVSDIVDKLAADPRFMGYDIYGAISKGVTGWNSVFGFEALKVRKATKDDNYAQDDKNFIIVDTDPSFGAAFANWRDNPNTSEIRGASVYMNSLWLEIADIIFDDDPLLPLSVLGTKDKPKMPMLTWGPLPFKKDDTCVLWAPIYKGERLPKDVNRPIPFPGGTLLTKKQKVEQYLTHVVMHEVGHTLGLRHNFKGSLKFDDATKTYSSSVMEYIDDFDAVFADKPGSYDIDAIKYLYGLSMNRPTDKFCNDSGVATDPDCMTFDRTADPYTTSYLDDYLFVMKDYLDGKSGVSPNSTLNAVLGYVRNGQTAATRGKALTDALDTMGYSVRVGKVDAMKLMMLPGYGARVDLLGRRIVQRLYMDDAALRGRFKGDPTDAAVFNTVFAEAVKMIGNDDKIRSADTRRVLATWMKKLQTVEAMNALAVGASKLDGEIRTGVIVDPTELAKAVDTLKYMDKLLNPYFN